MPGGPEDHSAALDGLAGKVPADHEEPHHGPDWVDDAGGRSSCSATWDLGLLIGSTRRRTMTVQEHGAGPDGGM